MVRRPPLSAKTPATPPATPSKPGKRQQPRPRMPAQVAPLTDKLLLSLPHAAHLMDLSERTLRDMLVRREVTSIRVGGRHLVPRVAIESYIAQQMAAQGGDAAAASAAEEWD